MDYTWSHCLHDEWVWFIPVNVPRQSLNLLVISIYQILLLLVSIGHPNPLLHPQTQLITIVEASLSEQTIPFTRQCCPSSWLPVDSWYLFCYSDPRSHRWQPSCGQLRREMWGLSGSWSTMEPMWTSPTRWIKLWFLVFALEFGWKTGTYMLWLPVHWVDEFQASTGNKSSDSSLTVHGSGFPLVFTIFSSVSFPVIAHKWLYT